MYNSSSSSEDRYRVVVRLATKYSSGSRPEYNEVLDDLRELMILTELATCLNIKRGDINVDARIASIRRLRSNEYVPMR